MSNLLKQLRLAKGWSQEQLAEASKVGRATIQRIETGRSVPSKETALSLASALNADPVQLWQAAGLAARVLRVAAINNVRTPTVGEVRTLPPKLRQVFSDFAAAKEECVRVTHAMAAASERSAVEHGQRMSALSEVSRLLSESRTRPDDQRLRVAYNEAIARVTKLPLPDVEETVALNERTVTAMQGLSEKGMALTRLLFAFV
jgi:transcriptional regulator with XRE-family HTH domain